MSRAERIRRLPPALLAAVIQLAVLLPVIVFWIFFPLEAAGPVVLQSLLAAWLARRAGMKWWWQAILLVFVPLLLAAYSLALPPVWYLAVFLLLALVFRGAVHERVPLYLTGPRTIRVLTSLLPARAGLRLLDVGAGWGGLLAGVTQVRPDMSVEGIENAPLSYCLGRLRLMGCRNAKLMFGNLWQRDLAEYDVVYAFLSPAVMERLWQKAAGEMRPGSLLISNSFEVPGIPADEVAEVGDRRSTRLYLWRFPRPASAGSVKTAARQQSTRGK